MTRARIFGSDAPFSDWCRSCADLPANAADIGWVATDLDLVLHLYKQDRSRDLQCLMLLEVKTRGGLPSKSQVDTFAKIHHSRRLESQFAGLRILNYGVSFVLMSGTTPDDSTSMTWCRFFDGSRILHQTPIDRNGLIRLMRFEWDPDFWLTQSLVREKE